MGSNRMPVLFVSHGAGPAWLLDGKDMQGCDELDKNSKSCAFMKSIMENPEIPQPKQIVVISAHWETTDFTVMINDTTKLLYDYGGFPKESYNLNWPAPGAKQAGYRVKELLEDAGLKCHTETERGLDHGVFIPLMLMFPKANIPVTEISLKKNMSIGDHLKLGEALAPLRDEGILLIGSGYTSHNESPSGTPTWLKEWQTWVNDAVSNKDYTPEQRKIKFQSVSQVESFRKAHPTLDHFLPLPVALAASRYQAGKMLFEDIAMGSLICSTFLFC